MNFCESCGAKLEADSKFCIGCGAKVTDAANSEAGSTDVDSDYISIDPGYFDIDNDNNDPGHIDIDNLKPFEFNVISNTEKTDYGAGSTVVSDYVANITGTGGYDSGSPGSNEHEVVITRHKREDTGSYQNNEQPYTEYQSIEQPYNEYHNEGYAPSQISQQQYNQQYNQQQNQHFSGQYDTRSQGGNKKNIAIVALIAAVLLLGGVVFFGMFNGAELVGNLFSGNTNNTGGPAIGGDTTPPVVTSSPNPGQEGQDDTPVAPPDAEYIFIPDLTGLHQSEADGALRELGVLPEYLFMEDDLPEGTVLQVTEAGTEVMQGSTVRVLVSSGPSYIIIDNPRIVVTARYDSGRGRFSNRDAYADSVRAAGGIPYLPGDDNTIGNMFRTGNANNADAIAEQYDGLVLTGGGDISARFFGQTKHPASEEPDENCDIAEIALCNAFIKAGKPVLGINRGMQIINVAMGGDIIQDIPDLLSIASDVHSGQSRHTIEIEPNTWLYDLHGNSLLTYSNHHQAIGRLADGFTIVARYGVVVEAIQNGNILGVQFNPDRLSDGGALIYSDFIRRCSHIPIR